MFIVTTLSKDAGPGLPPEAIGFRGADGSRGYPSLAVLTLVSAGIAWAAMRNPTITARISRF